MKLLAKQKKKRMSSCLMLGPPLLFSVSCFSFSIVLFEEMLFNFEKQIEYYYKDELHKSKSTRDFPGKVRNVILASYCSCI